MKNLNIEIQNKTMYVNAAIPVEVGQIKLKNILMISVYRSKTLDKICFDIDDNHYEDVTYMGMELEDKYKSFNKLREFHKELGIDIDKLISNETDRLVPYDELVKWIEENFKDLI
jgi:hypothetical protein